MEGLLKIFLKTILNVYFKYYISNKHLKLSMTKSVLLIHAPKPVSNCFHQLFPICLNDTIILSCLDQRPKNHSWFLFALYLSRSHWLYLQNTFQISPLTLPSPITPYFKRSCFPSWKTLIASSLVLLLVFCPAKGTFSTHL